MNQRFFSSEEKGLIFFRSRYRIMIFDNREKSVFLDFQFDDAQVFNFSSFFFLLQSHFGFTCFFSSIFIFVVQVFFSYFFITTPHC